MSYISSLNTHNGKVGKIGEDFAVEFLSGLGYKIIVRNLRNKLGEIDIVAELKGKLHIVEVKTSQSLNVRPEENMHATKMRKVARLGQMYAKERLFSIDFVGVSLNSDYSLKKITHLDNLEIY